jgi:hypothetical protein
VKSPEKAYLSRFGFGFGFDPLVRTDQS